MQVSIITKNSDYILNHCTKYLARDNIDNRNSFFNQENQGIRSSISEPWRFPIVDACDDDTQDASEFNHVSFVFRGNLDKSLPQVALLSDCALLYYPIPLKPVEDSIFLTLTLRVPKGRRFRYRFVVDGATYLDPINPQIVTMPTGEIWSSFYTWAYNEPINFERWQMALLERLSRTLLPFNGREARNFLDRAVNAGNVQHLFRLSVPVGVANYIDNIVAREERHQLQAYQTCLTLIDRVLRQRNPGIEPRDLEDGAYEALFRDMKINAPSLFQDGWDARRYDNPAYFLYVIRRHAWTGAFSHPKYGGNPGGMAWAFLGETYSTTGDSPPLTAYDWRRALEAPLGASTEYRG